MTNDHIYSKYSEVLLHRSQHPMMRLPEHTSGDHMLVNLQTLVYHMIHEVPGAAEYVKRQTELMDELSRKEGIGSVLDVPAENL